MIADIEQKWREISSGPWAPSHETIRHAKIILSRAEEAGSDPVRVINTHGTDIFLRWESEAQRRFDMIWVPENSLTIQVSADRVGVYVSDAPRGREYGALPPFVIRNGCLQFKSPDAPPSKADLDASLVLRRLLAKQDQAPRWTRKDAAIFDRAVEILQQSIGFGTVPPDYARFSEKRYARFVEDRYEKAKESRLSIAWLRNGWRFELERRRPSITIQEAKLPGIEERKVPIDPRYTAEADVARLIVEPDQVILIVNDCMRFVHHVYDTNKPFVIANDEVTFREPDGTVSAADKPNLQNVSKRPIGDMMTTEVLVEVDTTSVEVRTFADECDSPVVIE